MPDRVRHLLTLADLSDEELTHLVDRSCAIAAGDTPSGNLRGRVVGIYFTKTSTRTRTAFSAAALRMGAGIIAYGPGDLQVNTGETLADTGRVLARMLDALVVRTAGPPHELATLAAQRRMAVINAMTADEHPTQALADLCTMQLHFGDIRGLRVLYVGEGNNTAAALALAMSRYPKAELHLPTPPGYGLHSDHTQRHDMDDLPGEIDVVYTTRWQTTGTTKPDPDWRNDFAAFHVGLDLMARYPNALFMHDLPAHRGEEVAAEVLDGPRSIAFDQAEQKLHSATAVLEWAVGADRW